MTHVYTRERYENKNTRFWATYGLSLFCGIALRYWNDSCKGGRIVVHLIDFKQAEDRSAKGLLGISLSTPVDEHDISFTDGVVSNSFDGASVMSGEKGKLDIFN